MKVYVIETGSYSDRDIRAIFSTRAKAQKYIDACNASAACYWKNDFNDIREWLLDKELAETDYTRWIRAIFLDTGDELTDRTHQQEMWGIPENRVYVCRKVSSEGGKDIIIAESHRSSKHALKLAIEKRQQILREQGARR